MLTETKSYKSKFNQWVKDQDIKVLEKLENSDLRIGDKVTFTNDYGVKFENLEVLGFRNRKDFLPNNVVYLDKDSYWFAVQLKELNKS